MSISTRGGDLGTTQLFGGPRVSKASARVEAYGTVDELGAQLGLCRVFAARDPLASRLEVIQRDLFLVAGELATAPEHRAILSARLTEEHVAKLDAQVAEIEAMPGLLDDWALPGATQVGSLLDVARTVCRRAERRVVALLDAGEEPSPDPVLPYLNRLGDLLWLYARWFELRQGADGSLRRR